MNRQFVTPAPRAAYIAEEVNSDLLRLEDMNGDVTVTNDAEAVVARLAEVYPDLPARRVIYRDSLGSWDELVVTPEGVFAGFRLLLGRSFEEAVMIARESADGPIMTLADLTIC